MVLELLGCCGWLKGNRSDFFFEVTAFRASMTRLTSHKTKTITHLFESSRTRRNVLVTSTQ